jgi:hypothetical protein
MGPSLNQGILPQLAIILKTQRPKREGKGKGKVYPPYGAPP